MSSWTDEERYSSELGFHNFDFSNFIKNHLESYEKLWEGKYNVFQIAKQFFQYESLVERYEDVTNFCLRLPDFLNLNCFNLGIPLITRNDLVIRLYKISNDPCIYLNFYTVQNAKGLEILVHKSAKEFYKKYL